MIVFSEVLELSLIVLGIIPIKDPTNMLGRWNPLNNQMWFMYPELELGVKVNP